MIKSVIADCYFHNTSCYSNYLQCASYLRSDNPRTRLGQSQLHVSGDMLLIYMCDLINIAAYILTHRIS